MNLIIKNIKSKTNRSQQIDKFDLITYSKMPQKEMNMDRTKLMVKIRSI